MGNIAVHLPDADVLIQVSSQQGLRQQEEVQRLGREGCPGKIGARMQFYTLVSLRTCEEDFARHRQLFLTEQGYSEDCEGVIFQHAAVQRSLSMLRVDSWVSRWPSGLPGVLAVVAPGRVVVWTEAKGAQE